MSMTLIGGIFGLALLYYGAEFLVKGGSAIALKLKVSPLVIGLTLVAYATSAPEMVVSCDAAIKGLGDVSIGNVVGSNICNIALILGLCAIITPLQVNKKLLQFDVWLMIAASLALLGCFFLNSGVNRIEGAILLLCSIAYTVWSIYASRRESAMEESKSAQDAATEITAPPSMNMLPAIALAVGGISALVLGGKLFVNAATLLAQLCGVSDAVIGLTVVAVGTSLPELATSLVAAVRKEQDIAIGNVIGSNIFNIFTILGVAPLISPLQAVGINYVDIFLMLGLSLILYIFMKSNLKISRTECAILLAVYIAYTVYLIMR
ncbi:MAG: calcium/sodium antiporter [Lentisphaerae bacterium]|nr:calcium/sodium antiporter [Lentisphaerota bacterium]